MKVAWVMNLDAELELASPSEYSRSTRMLARLADRGSELVATFERCFGIQAVLVDGELDMGWTGQAWCPTQSAHAALARCGVAKLHSPSTEVIARVNHRAFAVEILQTLPGSCFVTTLAELDAVVSQDSPLGWLLKRPYGFAGRSRKHLEGPPRGADRTWAEASMRAYGLGLQVEPCVDIELEVSMHGILAESCAAAFGPAVVQNCDQAGAWISQRPVGAGELTEADLSSFAVNAQTVVRALADASYFGPFSIDGFVWRSSDGERRVQPLSDLNARYTMGFFEAMAGRSEVLDFIEFARR